MPIAELGKSHQEISDSPRINRLVKHVNHMKKRVAVAEPALKEHIQKMLEAAEDALQEAIKDFQEICEHDFIEVNDTSPNFWQGEPVIIVKLTGYKCRKCLLSKPVQSAQ